jgi:hypothetical protein
MRRAAENTAVSELDARKGASAAEEAAENSALKGHGFRLAAITRPGESFRGL